MTDTLKTQTSRHFLWVGLFVIILLLSLGYRLQHAYAQQVSSSNQTTPPPGTTPPPSTTPPPGTTPTNPVIPQNKTIPENQLYLSLVLNNAAPSPTHRYTSIPVLGNPTDRPAAEHPDINLAVRGYTNTIDSLTLVDINGPTDSDAPQIMGLFVRANITAAIPTIASVHQVYDWDWGCPDGLYGCRTQPIAVPAVTMMGFALPAGTPLSIPTRHPEIYAGDYKAMVLYADASRITIAYTREDTVAIGYVVHIEDMHVDVQLRHFYESLNNAGRGELPALRYSELIGYTTGQPVKVVIRDTGAFMDPRSRKDWWQGFR